MALAIVDEPQGSPRWWLKTLDAKRVERNNHFETYDDWYEGRHELRFATEQFILAFGALYEDFADNWCRLVVDACRERLTPVGFTLPDGRQADQAWGWWQDSGMDAEFQVGLTEGLKASEFSISVFLDTDGSPSIAVEDPMEVIVAHSPGDRGSRRAALKVWADEWTGEKFARLWLPDNTYRFRTRGALGNTGLWTPSSYSTGTSQWVEMDDKTGHVVPNQFGGRIPVVPVLNNPRTRPDKTTKLWASSEIDPVINNQAAVNKLVADMMLVSESAGFPGKWATGVKPPRDPATGKVLQDEYRATLSKILTSSEPTSRFGNFEAADLKNNVTAIENRIQAIASQSRTPPHYFYLKGTFPSGESLKAAEAGLVAKARDKMTVIGEALEEVIALCFVGAESVEVPRTISRLETAWNDPEYHTEAARADAMVKLVKAGIIPKEAAQEALGFSPTQRARMREAFRREMADAAGSNIADLLNATDDAEDEEDGNVDVPAVA